MEKALLEEHVRYGEARFKDKKLVRPFVNRIHQDIAELEKAIKLKTCDECKHLDGVICKHDRGLYCVRQFEADYYEPKDNA